MLLPISPANAPTPVPSIDADWRNHAESKYFTNLRWSNPALSQFSCQLGEVFGHFLLRGTGVALEMVYKHQTSIAHNWEFAPLAWFVIRIGTNCKVQEYLHSMRISDLICKLKNYRDTRKHNQSCTCALMLYLLIYQTHTMMKTPPILVSFGTRPAPPCRLFRRLSSPMSRVRKPQPVRAESRVI